MIIIHTDSSSNGSNPGVVMRHRHGSHHHRTTTSSTTLGGNIVRVVRPQRKDWVRFDSSDSDSESEGGNDTLKSVEIDESTNRLNLQLDLDRLESVEINFVRKRSAGGRRGVGEGVVGVRRNKTSDILVRNLEILRLSGFYYEKNEFNGETCTKLLSTTTPGTFLVRDSSDPNYLFTLSLQTERGPTSVRLVYWKTETSGGEFRLDAADQRLIGALPGFENVVKLVQYYVEENNRTNCKNKLERKGLKTSNRQVWIDSATGRTHSAVKLVSPLRQTVPSLKHLSRLALNGLNCRDHIFLPAPVQQYLQSYPFVL